MVGRSAKGDFDMMIMNTFWILILGAGLFFLVKWLTTAPRVRQGRVLMSGSGLSALEILKERYARGEIDWDQLESMKQDLEKI
jgi:putative membrane protein